jgi:Uma2 family endonuclease
MIQAVPGDSCVYPESDAKPLPDNSLQFRWIMVIADSLTAMFKDAPDVYVACHVAWYPVEGKPEIVQTPDVLVVFGRPRGERIAYWQWEEDGVPVTVAFKVLFPNNSYIEMEDQLLFCEEYGVEEYYVYDPGHNRLLGYVRRGSTLERIRPSKEHVSPRLGVRFDLSGPEMIILGPTGRRFLTFAELLAQRDQERRRAVLLAELSRKARQQQASPEELAELERLERELSPPSS